MAGFTPSSEPSLVCDFNPGQNPTFVVCPSLAGSGFQSFLNQRPEAIGLALQQTTNIVTGRGAVTRRDAVVHNDLDVIGQ